MSLVKRSVDPNSAELQPEGGACQAHEQEHVVAGVGQRRRAEQPRAHRRERRVLHVPHVVDHELRRLSLADRGEREDRRAITTKAARRATSRPTTRRSRAMTCSCSVVEPAAGGKIAPVRSSSALVLSSTQREPREDLHPAAADRGQRLQLAGVQPALPAHRAQDRDQDLHRLPFVEGERQQRHHGAAAGAGNQLHQLRRLQRLCGRRRADQRRQRDRMG